MCNGMLSGATMLHPWHALNQTYPKQRSCRTKGEAQTCSTCTQPWLARVVIITIINVKGPVQVAADFAFIPFGGGARKCVGDQFALLEATVALSMLLR